MRREIATSLHHHITTSPHHYIATWRGQYNPWPGDLMLKGTAREAAAEFLGTFILIMFGVGVVAQTVLSRGANGSFLAINIGWGLGVMLGVYAAAGVSGAHLNPAVTVALAVTRGFAWSKVTSYVIAQIVGAFVAAAIVYLTYYDA